MNYRMGGGEYATNKEELSASDYWRPLEQKEFPPYITERFKVLNDIHALDYDSISSDFSSPSRNERDLGQIGYYLGQCIKEARADGEISQDEVHQLAGLVESGLSEAGSWEDLDLIEALGDCGDASFVSRIEKFRNGSIIVDAYVLKAIAKLDSNLAIYLMKKEQWPNAALMLEVYQAMGGEKAVNGLLKWYENTTNFDIRSKILQTLGEVATEADISNILGLEKNASQQSQAVVAIAKIGGNRAYEIVKQLAAQQPETEEARRNISEALSEFPGRESFNLLLAMKNAEEDRGQAESKLFDILEVLDKFPIDLTMPFIQETLNNLATMNLSSAQKKVALLKIAMTLGEQGGQREIGDLQSRFGGQDPDCDRAIRLATLRTRYRHEDKDALTHKMIVSEEPLLALAEGDQQGAREILHAVESISDIVKMMQVNHPELIGCLVGGSFSKGYWDQELSDLDFSLIIEPGSVSTANILSLFNAELGKAGLPNCCAEWRHVVSSHNPGEFLFASVGLYTGTFVGDRTRFDKFREEVYNAMDESHWDQAEKQEIKYERVREDMETRFGFKPAQIKMIGKLRAYLWGSPNEDERIESSLTNLS